MELTHHSTAKNSSRSSVRCPALQPEGREVALVAADQGRQTHTYAHTERPLGGSPIAQDSLQTSLLASTQATASHRFPRVPSERQTYLNIPACNKAGIQSMDTGNPSSADTHRFRSLLQHWDRPSLTYVAGVHSVQLRILERTLPLFR
jgi:hypothetical protein